LIGPLLVENLRYRDGDLDVVLRRGELDWSPRELISSRVHLALLQADGLELHLPQAAPEPEPQEPQAFRLEEIAIPLQLEIADLRVNDARIWTPGTGRAIVIDELSLRARTQDRTVIVESFDARAPQGDIELSGQFELAGSNALQLLLDARLWDPDYGPLSARAKASGELGGTVLLDFSTSGVVSAELHAQAFELLTRPSWSAELAGRAPDLGPFVAALSGSPLSARLRSDGSVDDFHAKGELATQLPDVGDLDADFEVSGNTTLVQVVELVVRTAGGSRSVKIAGNVDLEALKFDASGQWEALAWPLTGQAQIESPTGEIALDGTIQDYRLELNASLATPETGALGALVEARGSDAEIRFSKVLLQAPDGDPAVEAAGDLRFSDLAFQADGHWQSLRWPMTGKPRVESPRGELSARGSPEAYEAQVRADLTTAQSGTVELALQAVGTDQEIEVPNLSLRASEGETSLDAKGALSFSGLAFEASGQWRSLVWPLIGTPQVHSPEGEFQARGKPVEYHFELDTQLQGIQLPDSRVSLKGQGSDKALEAVTLDAKLLDGEIRAEAKAAWDPAVSWEAKIKGHGLDPGVQWPDLAGTLALELKSRGTLADGAMQAELQLADLSGSLRGQRVRGKAQVRVRDEDLRIETLQFQAGGAQLEAAGSLAEEWDIRWQLQAPDLAALLPDAAGRVSGSGEFSGPRAQPRGQLSVSVAELAYGETAVGRLEAKANVDVSGRSRSNLRITAEALRLAGQGWKRFRLDGAGTPARHTLDGALSGDAGRFGLVLQGSFDEGQQAWQGRLTRLNADETPLGDWDLDKPMALRVSGQEAAAQRSCLVSPPAQICLQGQWSAESGGGGRFELERLDLERFAFLLPVGTTLETRLSGQGSVSVLTDGRLQGKAEIGLSPGRLLVPTSGGSPAEIRLPGGELLRAETDGNSAKARLGLVLGKIGEIKFAAQISDLSEQQRLKGTLDARLRDLGVVSAFVPQVSNVSGHALADLQLSGTLKTPAVNGGVRLDGGGLEVPALAARIQDIRVAAVGNAGETLKLSGSARSGPGELRLSGEVRPSTGALRLNLAGQDFQVADSPEIQALISPDLSLSMEPGAVRVEGKLVIPKAKLAPAGSRGRSSGDVVSASPDVVIVTQADGTTSPTEEKRGPPVFADVRVTLGDVHIKAFDFNGKLKGQLRIVEKPGLLLRGTGRVEVAAGEYTISGQRLNIERGRVLYNNSLLVGAQVTGRLQAPNFSFFSNPAMPDDLIVSYLVFGRALKTDEGSSVALGKYLSPDLYVGYDVGMFNALSTFITRYRLSDSISVEASSNSESSGGDLLYIKELR
jgi:translocation and assembly module TamB